jgi:hypothetical protein
MIHGESVLSSTAIGTDVQQVKALLATFLPVLS